MSIGYRSAAIFFFIWGISAIFTAIIELEDNPGNVAGSAAGFEGFINRIGNPENISVTDPNLGYQAIQDQTTAGTVMEYGKMSVGWLKFLGKSFVLDSPIWSGWAAPIRYILITMAAPFMMIITLQVASMVSNFIGGIFGRASVR